LPLSEVFYALILSQQLNSVKIGKIFGYWEVDRKLKGRMGIQEVYKKKAALWQPEKVFPLNGNSI